MQKIRELLFAAADLDYAKFNARLIPNIDPERIIGVRSPKLRSIAAGMEAEDRRRFLSSLPHFYHEENMLRLSYRPHEGAGGDNCPAGCFSALCG